MSNDPTEISLRDVGIVGEEVISFGPFRLYASRRLIERAGVPLHLGARALEILIVLVRNASKVVNKNDLMAMVWPNVTVGEGCLRVHVAALRKALGDGTSGARYVTNISSRGYCFVAPVSYSNAPRPLAPESCDAEQSNRLPSLPKRVIGRDETALEISNELASERFVSITGPGGIGKTTVAISVAQKLLADFAGAVCFFGLGSLNDSLVVPSFFASKLGLSIRSSDPIPAIISFLRDRRMLLIIDNCEHVIEAAAALTERIFQAAPEIHILATSREFLRAEGERVYCLSPLGCPPDNSHLTAAQTLTFPAVQLFVERAAASGARFGLKDVDAPAVAEICCRLDGNALGIELAAARVNTCSIRDTIALLNDRSGLLLEGRRTALPRHKTLMATFDWSYGLLSEPERIILRRLSVFVGVFTLEAACSVATDGEIDDRQVVIAVGRLVTKSLLAVSVDAETTWYRLLNSTRTCAASKLVEYGETDTVRQRHSIYCHKEPVRPDRSPSVTSEASSLPAIPYGVIAIRARSSSRMSP
jgi:predicted ATPase/DNA-binding winged helix-turn-helix (wHTH) protein